MLFYSISNSAKAHNFTGSNLQEVFNAVKKAGELAGVGVESVILIVREHRKGKTPILSINFTQISADYQSMNVWWKHLGVLQTSNQKARSLHLNDKSAPDEFCEFIVFIMNSVSQPELILGSIKLRLL